MGVIFGLIFWLIGIGVSLAILHWIIRSAIDNSELTTELKELKELLQTQQLSNLKEPQITKSRNTNDTNLTEKCPGCGEPVHINDHECRSCGLALMIDDN